MLPQDFHPVLRRWWDGRFAEPTSAQLDGWSAIRRGEHTLIAAPTGSGKTLAAFLTAIDRLLREGLERGALPDEVRVVYVSPLKALSADIHNNLAEPRREIRALADSMGFHGVRITAAVRSGDTPQSERAAMLRTPPHILVTTPESLYLLLTAERSRAMLRTAQAVIVDEIHAVLQSRRGAHLALSLERLDHVCGRRLQRIGLSATQKPIEEVARFLTSGSCVVVDKGHKRQLDLAVEVPGSPLEAVMSHEVWQEIYARLVQLVESHRTTLIMVNTRRLAERMAHQLSERLGNDCVAAHHGSLAKEARLDAEQRLREGKLKVLVATASLELGIDIGHVDLVCQISSPHRIASFLQRVGRSGHTVKGVPKGRIFPLTRDDLVECAAMARAVHDGELDRVAVPDKPLDVLAQQIVAEASAEEEWDENALFALFTQAYPYRHLGKDEYEGVVEMLARGYATRRGRRGALIHHDSLNKKVRSRKGSRMSAIVNGGAIPEVFDYRVLLEPEGHFVGTLNEDFAIESLPGDVFQLGNTSWRILRIGNGVVRVADAQGQPPSMPFWLGEAPARSDEMSAAVSRLRAAVDERLPGQAVDFLMKDYSLPRAAAEQIAQYLDEAKRALGVVPTMDSIALERFFDESGGMQLVLHAPFGSRVNRAWGLALRKKFCQGFNFELQAAATEEGLILSLASVHSFPLEEVFRYLRPDTVRETLTQAILASPIFETRWRWSATLALAVPRNRGGARIPNQLQRMYAEDLLQAVFPDAVACQDNLQGAREIPEHPLVNQALRDALEEAVDLPGLERVLRRLIDNQILCVARDTPEPSVLSHELLNSAVYTFLDDAPLEERRARAVYARRATELRSADDLGALDPAAIERVRQEAWPVANTADEMYDALMVAGCIRESEFAPHWFSLSQELGPRAVKKNDAWFALERINDDAVELEASRLEVLGPVAETENAVLLALEGQGRILRGRFTPGAAEIEWCDRRLLARIHRYTLNRLRAEVEPASAADFMRFLLHWQHVAGEDLVKGAEGLAAVVAQLEGFEVAAAGWEHDVLPARVADYGPEQLDRLCLSGRVAWGRLTPGSRAPLRTSPIALVLREHAPHWGSGQEMVADFSSEAIAVREALEKRGASFFHELVAQTRLLPAFVERALAELAGAGVATADSFAGLRALLAPADRRKGLIEEAGRWSLLATERTQDVEAIARTLLKRYGVVFRTLLQREGQLPPWREVVRVYRRLEARGEIRGGRFAAGFGGEQFAAPDAVGRLRAVRKSEKIDELVVLSAADPLNLVGILTPHARIAAIHKNRILLKDGLPIAALEGGAVRRLADSAFDDDFLKTLLVRRSLRQPLKLHLREPSLRERTMQATPRAVTSASRA
ncbi:MAG: ATP-dependent DNA helicase [Betaproteobacteria bacterium RIFCSPLOWO2_12_FULL_65_14]|nr:MAG: ATP-dependent DNA helicase [Betaproteobacteria bacterium RIFCSPLOWO2_12_FULL_65_14]